MAFRVNFSCKKVPQAEEEEYKYYYLIQGDATFSASWPRLLLQLNPRAKKYLRVQPFKTNSKFYYFNNT
jgi:hypothetical protein